MNAQIMKRSTKNKNICRVPNCSPIDCAMRNFKLPIQSSREFLFESSPGPDDSANPQRPMPSLASSDGALRSGWMEAEGSWLFEKALGTARR